MTSGRDTRSENERSRQSKMYFAEAYEQDMARVRTEKKRDLWGVLLWTVGIVGLFLTLMFLK